MLLQKREENPSRLIASVLRGVLAEERFACYADLVDALKFRLARMRIRWRPDDLTEAIALVESNTETLADAPRLPGVLVERPPTPAERPATYAEAVTRLKEIRAHGLDVPLNAIPMARGRDETARAWARRTAREQARLETDAEQRAAEMGIDLTVRRPRLADARRAFAMIADEIAAASARCDALEREVAARKAEDERE